MSNSKTILVSAFEPFGGDTVNPTQLVLERLPGEIDGFKIEKILLPVEFTRSAELLFECCDAVSPSAVVMLGLAGGRASITPERVGKNVMNARIPDAVGYKPENLIITENGKDELPSTLPVEKIVRAIGAAGVSASLSEDAGAYVCNSLLYRMLGYNNGKVPTGFIHVPYIKEQGREPYLELDDIFKGIIAALRAIIEEIRE